MYYKFKLKDLVKTRIYINFVQLLVIACNILNIHLTLQWKSQLLKRAILISVE